MRRSYGLIVDLEFCCYNPQSLKLRSTVLVLGPIFFCSEILGSRAEILSTGAEVLRSAPAMFRSDCKVLCSDAEISNSGATTRNRRWQGNSPYSLRDSTSRYTSLDRL